jgi:hypothetical protein
MNPMSVMQHLSPTNPPFVAYGIHNIETFRNDCVAHLTSDKILTKCRLLDGRLAVMGSVLACMFGGVLFPFRRPTAAAGEETLYATLTEVLDPDKREFTFYRVAKKDRHSEQTQVERIVGLTTGLASLRRRESRDFGEEMEREQELAAVVGQTHRFVALRLQKQEAKDLVLENVLAVFPVSGNWKAKTDEPQTSLTIQQLCEKDMMLALAMMADAVIMIGNNPDLGSVLPSCLVERFCRRGRVCDETLSMAEHLININNALRVFCAQVLRAQESVELVKDAAVDDGADDSDDDDSSDAE